MDHCSFECFQWRMSNILTLLWVNIFQIETFPILTKDTTWLGIWKNRNQEVIKQSACLRKELWVTWYELRNQDSSTRKCNHCLWSLSSLPVHYTRDRLWHYLLPPLGLSHNQAQIDWFGDGIPVLHDQVKNDSSISSVQRGHYFELWSKTSIPHSAVVCTVARPLKTWLYILFICSTEGNKVEFEGAWENLEFAYNPFTP